MIKNKSDDKWIELEKKFFSNMVSRLEACEEALYSTGMFTDKCLLQMPEVEGVNPKLVKMVEKCV